MAVPADAPITKLLPISTTREQALKIPGAEECELGDVCLPLTSMAAAKLSPLRRPASATKSPSTRTACIHEDRRPGGQPCERTGDHIRSAIPTSE